MLPLINTYGVHNNELPYTAFLLLVLAAIVRYCIKASCSEKGYCSALNFTVKLQVHFTLFCP